MPTLLIWRGYKFRFYALDMREPPHIHVVRDGKSMKVWLADLKVARNTGYTDREVAEVLRVVAEHRDQWTGAWNDFFGI